MQAPRESDDNKRPGLENLAEEIYASLADQFPVCLFSDEFHFFPQYRAAQPDWSRWDDFSGDAVHAFLERTTKWLESLEGFRSPQQGSVINEDVELIQKLLITLQEQIGNVCPHKNQPTFYLSIISIGLAEALEASQDAFSRRLMGLPAFIQTAITNLGQVPAVFKDLGLEMISKIKAWMQMLPLSSDGLGSVMAALERFGQHLTTVETTADFRLPQNLYARIADYHIGCRMGLEEIARHLEQEIDEAAHLLIESAARISPGRPWLSVFKEIAEPAVTNNDAASLYREVIAGLKNHCLDHGFMERAVTEGCDVQIQTIPDHLLPVRANAAYSMPPEYPPKGGVFYILPSDRQVLPRDRMMLAAHETYPGHHLLDTHRWRLEQPLRRSLEFPIFYEGWASFGEEILFDTGYFSGPVDRLLTAKRRFWRAHRGLADLSIHTGRCSLEEAAAELGAVGLVTIDKARAMVRRYALKPGYQLTYAVGRRKFRRLYGAFLGRGRTPAQFVRQVLSQGEISFDHLAQRLLY